MQFIFALNTISGIVAVSLCRLTMSFFLIAGNLCGFRGNDQSLCYASRTALQSGSELRLGSWSFRSIISRCTSGDVQFSRLRSAAGL